MSEIETGKKFKSLTPGNDIFWYGGGKPAYDSLEEAKAIVLAAVRSGKTVGVIEEGKIVEYIWHPEDLTDEGLVLKTSSPKTEFKLVCKTNSIDSSWYINGINVNRETGFKIIDNSNGSLIVEGVFSPSVQLTANLSQSSGDASIWLDLDDNGNGVTTFNDWGNLTGGLNYINLDFFPLLKVFLLYYGSAVTTVIQGFLLNLESFSSYNSTFVGVNFINTTKLTSINIYGTVTFDVPVDVSNNPNLTSYAVNVATANFNVSNHRLLEVLKFNNNDILDLNINTNYLPNLKDLQLFNNVITLDLNVNDLIGLEKLVLSCDNLLNYNLLSSLTYLSMSCYNNTSLSFSEMTALKTLVINDIDNVNGVLDLKPLVNLLTFQLNYDTHSGITEIDISNGLNAFITYFKRQYVTTGIMNVRVDNPVNANNEVTPYLSNVWIKQYLGNDVINFI